MRRISLGLVVGLLWATIGLQESLAQDPETAVRISVERAVVAVGEPFWVDVTVRWDQPGKPRGRVGPLVELPADSPFEVVRHVSARLAGHTESGPKPTARTVQEHHLRWVVRANQVGQHPLVVIVNGKPSAAPSPVVSVRPSRQAQAFPSR